MSYSVNLRKLSMKSTIGFGRYADMIVGNVLKVDPSYLSWLYYNKDKISFLPEVLEQLKITGELVIDKPGSDYRGHFAWKDSFYEGDDIQRMRDWHSKNHFNKTRKNDWEARDRREAFKFNNQQRNHGKKK